MAFSAIVSQVCVLVAALCALTYSQAPTGADQSLFNLMNPAPATGGALDNLLNMGAGNSFSPLGGAAPNPSFPTLGGAGSMPMGAATQTQQANPMANMLPFMAFSGMDFSNLMMMMLFGGMGGMGGGGGGMGGMGMLPMLGLLNNM